jgi:hypothetical protein
MKNKKGNQYMKLVCLTMVCAWILQPWQHPINSLITFRILCFWYSTHSKRSVVNNDDDFSYKQSVQLSLFGSFRSQDGVFEAKQRLHMLRLFRFGMDDSVGVAIRVSVGMTVGVAVLLVWFAVSMPIRVPISVSVGVSVGVRSIAVAVGVSVRVAIGLCLGSLLIKQKPNIQDWRICSPVSMNNSRHVLSRPVLLTGNSSYHGFLLLVRSLVEVGEEAEEQDTVASDPPDEGFGIIAVDEKQLEGVDDNCNKLDLKYQKTVNKAVAASENWHNVLFSFY